MTLISLKTSQTIDRLFAEGSYPKPFAFTAAVAEVFDDMVKRSIPFYEEVARMVLTFCEIYCPADSQIVDVGCSTGSLLRLLSEHLNLPLHLIGIDNSEAMLAKAKAKMSGLGAKDSVLLLCENALQCEYTDAAMIICNYTLQFISVRERKKLLLRFYTGLKKGGMLFLSEKVRAADPEIQEATTAIYEAYKRSRGYSQTEIARKKESLENVLVPVTLDEQIAWLKDCGFQSIEVVFKWHCFVSIVAVK